MEHLGKHILLLLNSVKFPPLFFLSSNYSKREIVFEPNINMKKSKENKILINGLIFQKYREGYTRRTE